MPTTTQTFWALLGAVVMDRASTLGLDRTINPTVNVYLDANTVIATGTTSITASQLIPVAYIVVSYVQPVPSVNLIWYDCNPNSTTYATFLRYSSGAWTNLASGAVVVTPGSNVGVGTGPVNLTGVAPLNSPTFTGTPTGPTPANGDNSTKLATTAYVQGQGFLTLAPVSSVAGRTGVVTLGINDVTGLPTALTVSGAVQSVAGKIGSVTLTPSDITGLSTVASTNSYTDLSNKPTIPTNTNQLTNGANFISASQAPVQSVAGKTGIVTLAVADVSGAAPAASPTFTGTVTAPTPVSSDNTTKVATTAFVKAQGYAVASNTVTSVAGRNGVVSLSVGDVSGAAPLASPTLTGTPNAPTASTSDNSTQIATTAFVKAQNYLTSADLGASPVQSVAGKTGIVTLGISDITGLSTAITNINNSIASVTANVVRFPSTISDSSSVSDTAVSASGNVLTNDTDTNGGTLSVSTISYGATAYTVGTPFATTYGTFNIAANGAWTFTLGSAARALGPGATVTETLSYGARDTAGIGTSNVTPLVITITGTNSAPVVSNVSSSIPADTTGTGNVLSGSGDPEGSAITVSYYTTFGSSTNISPGVTTTITGKGDITIASNGAWTFVPQTGFVGSVPALTFYVTDGVNTTPGTLNLTVAPAVATAASTQTWFNSFATLTPSNIAANPVGTRPAPDYTFVVSSYPNWDWTCPLPDRSGDLTNARDFRVGPGMEYTNIGDVPWHLLLPGDRVFIYWRSTPYKEFIYIPNRGDATRWIEVIGVPNGSGQMPVIDGAGATASSNFNWPPDHVGLGIVLITPKASGITYGMKPGYIHIHGLKFINARAGNSYTDAAGASGSWGDFSSAIAVHGADHVTISGCEISNCGIGVFVNSTQAERVQSRWTHILFNYIYGAGNVGTASEHNCYIEGIGTIYEFNYFDSLQNNSWGQFIKDRSAGVILRYNFFHNTNTCSYLIGMPDPDSNTGYENLQIDSLGDSLMSKIFIYGNTIVLDQPAANMYQGWPTALIEHGGGGAYPAFPQWRYGALHFYSNVLVSKVDQTTITGQSFNGTIGVFVLANVRAPTTVYAYNNLAYGTNRTSGPSDIWALFGCQGWASFQTNWFTTFQNSSVTTPDGSYNQGTPFNGTGLNGLVAQAGDPGFRGFSVGDYALLGGSPFFSLSTPIHSDAAARGLTVQTTSVITPFGIPPSPYAATLAAVTPATGTGVVELVTLNAVSPSWAFGVTSTSQAWKVDGTVVGTSSSYTPQHADLTKTLTYEQTATNSNGSTTSVSIGYFIATATQPLPSVAPSLTGIPMQGFVLVVNDGTWTNSPTSYTYEFLNISGGVISTGTYTPVLGDVGSQIAVRVTAHTSTESTPATSQYYTIAAIAYDPDALNVWNFTKADGTYLDTFDSRWQGSAGGYVVSSNAIEGAAAYNGAAFFANGQGADQSVGAVVRKVAGAFGAISLYLQTNSTQVGYEVALTTTTVTIWYGGSSVQSYTHGLSTASPVNFKVTLVAGELTIYLNGTNVLAHTFLTPDTGGFPGFKIQTPGGALTDVLMDSWTDTPA